MHLPLVSSDTFFLLFCSVYLGSGFRWQNHYTAILMTHATGNTQRPQKLLRVIHKVFLKTSVICGFGSITRYRRTQKRLKLQRWKASAGAAGHTKKRTMKRRNVEQCQRLTMVDCYSPVSTSYAMNCAQSTKVCINSKDEKNRATFALHDHSTGFSLRHRSCHKARFSLSPC